jgi:hypothetical protein
MPSISRAKIEIGPERARFSLQTPQKSRKLALFACRVCATRFISAARIAHADPKKVLDSSLRNANHSPQRNATSTISGTRVAKSEMFLTVPNRRSKEAATETNTKKYMQNYCKTIGALAAASALVAGIASAEVEYTLGTGYSSEYLFRGDNLGQDLVEVSASASTEWNGLGLSAGAWYGSYDTISEYDVDELDLFGEVSKDLGFATAAVGYIYYMNEDFFSRTGAVTVVDDTQEVYVKLSRDLGFANAYAAYYWDLEGDNEGYSELGFSRGFELNQCLTLNLGTNIGYMWEDDQDTSWTTKASLDWGFAESAKLSPFVALAVQLTDDNDNYTAGFGNELIGGCMLSTSF